MEINTLDIEKIVKQVMQSVEAAENKPQCSEIVERVYFQQWKKL